MGRRLMPNKALCSHLSSTGRARLWPPAVRIEHLLFCEDLLFQHSPLSCVWEPNEGSSDITSRFFGTSRVSSNPTLTRTARSQCRLHRLGAQTHEAVPTAEGTCSGVPRASALCWPTTKQSSHAFSGDTTLLVPQPSSSVNLIIQKLLSKLHYVGTSKSIIGNW